ncbi:DNA-processing protein DprA [Chamaesiphon sp.]|uniref:DNA-processing protein DprA n=1 Tax=Chamaesiphon sp. TaxID=2814140 RepID=UPI00359420C4
MSQERIYWLAWSQVAGVGAILIERLDRHFGNLAAAWNADRQQLLAIDGIGIQSVEQILTARAKIDPQTLFGTHSIANPHWWTRVDPDYPQLLLEIPSAPGVLYYKGQIATANRDYLPSIAIVGTRDPSDYGRRWARKIATLLASKGYPIVSGLAQGIDTEAHTACLEAGGRTIAVVGTGIDIVYPPRNQTLAANIAQHGLIVSEYPAGTPPDRGHFPARNRIIAGLSRVTIVIEAPTRSGALITAHQANDFGRDVYVLPGSIDNPNSLGCLGLLSRGAQPILGLEQLLELLSLIPQFDAPAQLQLFPTGSPILPTSGLEGTSAIAIASELPPDLSPDLQQIWLIITDRPTNLDEIVTRSQLSIAAVSGILLQLELLGLVTQLPGMRYQR